MSIQVTEKDRRLYTREYVNSLKESSEQWSKFRWFGIVISLAAFLLAIMALTSNDENQTRQIMRKAAATILVISGLSLFLLSVFQWNSRQREYEKGKAIREILDAEEAEMTTKNAQGKYEL